MKVIWSSTKANLYKMIHSKLVWLHMLLPAFAAIIFSLYYIDSPMQETEKVKLYVQVISIAFPLMIAIVTTMVYESDLNAGGFQMLRMLSDNKAKGHIGNLLSLLILGCVAGLIAVMGFGLLFQRENLHFLEISNFVFSISFYWNVAWLLFSVNTTGYVIQYVICYTFGKGASLGLGIVGMLFSLLMYTGIGDVVWKWIPCSYGIRMISYYLIKCAPKQDILPYIMKDYQTGGSVIVMITLLSGVLFCVWGALWQGAKTNLE